MKKTLLNGSTVQLLIDYINDKQLSPGHRLPPIKELAVELGLPPHAVRDALLQAQTMGLVQVRSRSGCYVGSVNFGPLVEVFSRSLPHVMPQRDHHLFDLLEARRLIEIELAGIAATRRRMTDLVPLRQALTAMYETPEDYDAYMTHNEAFHLGIARTAGNEVLLAMLQSLLDLLRPTLDAHKPNTWKDEFSEKRQRDAREHEAIFQALFAMDAPAARAAMAEHLRDTAESLLPAPAAAS
jgi:GntR family transcriptional repressor for pyruvate dehydrogenase complex